MSRTRDFESPDDQMRIDLIVEIIQTQHGPNSMSKSLELLRKFEEDMHYWSTVRGMWKLYRHRRRLKRAGV